MAEGLRRNQLKDLGSANCQRDGILLWLSSVDGQFLIFHVVDWIKHLQREAGEGRLIVEGTRVSLSPAG